MVLCLQELKLVLDPVAGVRSCEFQLLRRGLSWEKHKRRPDNRLVESTRWRDPRRKKEKADSKQEHQGSLVPKKLHGLRHSQEMGVQRFFPNKLWEHSRLNTDAEQVERGACTLSSTQIHSHTPWSGSGSSVCRSHVPAATM